MTPPTFAQATDFALMLDSGMPPEDALPYFFDLPLKPEDISEILPVWMGSKEVSNAVLALQGKPWQGMTTQQKIEFAINKHYCEMAYYLFAHNYAKLTGQYRAKADTCRVALEAKLAGTAGKMTSLDRFLDDALTGKIKLPSLQTH